MNEVRAIDSLEEATLILKNELENIAEGYISVGFYLKKVRDDELYKQKGYADVYEFAKETFQISRTWAGRFMEINDKYSVDGNSPEIQEKYRGYGSSKLSEMLTLPEEIREEVPKTATVREIREVKDVIQQTQKKFEPQMELCDIAQKSEEADFPWMNQAVLQFFRKDGKDRFEKMVDWSRKDIGNDMREIEEELLEIINPSKFRMMRMQTANVLMTEKIIKVMPYRDQGQQEEVTYIDFAKAFEEIFFPDYPDMEGTINSLYEKQYGEILFPEREKPKPPENLANTTPPKDSKPKDDKSQKKEQKKEKTVEEIEEHTEEVQEEILEGEVIGDILRSGNIEKILKLFRKEFELSIPKDWISKVVNLDEH